MSLSVDGAGRYVLLCADECFVVNCNCTIAGTEIKKCKRMIKKERKKNGEEMNSSVKHSIKFSVVAFNRST